MTEDTALSEPTRRHDHSPNPHNARQRITSAPIVTGSGSLRSASAGARCSLRVCDDVLIQLRRRASGWFGRGRRGLSEHKPYHYDHCSSDCHGSHCILLLVGRQCRWHLVNMRMCREVPSKKRYRFVPHWILCSAQKPGILGVPDRRASRPVGRPLSGASSALTSDGLRQRASPHPSTRESPRGTCRRC
jgi:hypothetical protein